MKTTQTSVRWVLSWALLAEDAESGAQTGARVRDPGGFQNTDRGVLTQGFGLHRAGVGAPFCTSNPFPVAALGPETSLSTTDTENAVRSSDFSRTTDPKDLHVD